MFNLIIFGPPGAGKGTQSIRLAGRYSLKHISTGDILREEVRAKSPLGIMAVDYMNQGKLVPDDLLIQMLQKVIEENRAIKGFVFDGFPRTIAQAEAFDSMLNANGSSVSMVLSLEVEDEELVSRLLKRAAEQGRTDDKPGVIRQRLLSYHEQTSPLLAYFEKQGKLTLVSGVGSIDDIFVSLCLEVEKVIKPD